MAITIQKQKAVEKPKLEKVQFVDPETLAEEALADEYGTIEDQYNALMQNPVVAQYEQVKKALAKRVKENYQPTDAIEITGAHWMLEISVAAKDSAKIGDMQLLRKFMGEQAFMTCAKITLTDARAYLTPEQLEKVLEPAGGYTDRRKVVAKFLG